MNPKNIEAGRKLEKLGQRLRLGLVQKYGEAREFLSLPDAYKDVVREQYAKEVEAGRIIPPPAKPKKVLPSNVKSVKKLAQKKSHSKKH